MVDMVITILNLAMNMENQMSDFLSDIRMKALVLHQGFRMTDSAQNAIGSGYLLKRRVYSNYDDSNFLLEAVPPEIVFPKSGIVATAILKNSSPLVVDYQEGRFLMYNEETDSEKTEVNFLKRPPFYGKRISNGNLVESYVTKLFGHSLGIFAKTGCLFARQGKVCKFCSISANQGRPKDICRNADVSAILEAVEKAVILDDSINDVFISGGVGTDDFDENFVFYSDLAIAIKEKLISLEKSVEVTLNTYPPRDLKLIDRLENTGIAVMISLETVDDEMRSFICPGKSELFSEIVVDNLLKKLVSVVGYGRVLTFLIQGIEDDRVILKGVERLAKMGVCAVVHILHVDPGTWVSEQNMSVPDPDRILAVAREASRIYRKYSLNSAVLYGGRSSLDGEYSEQVW